MGEWTGLEEALEPSTARIKPPGHTATLSVHRHPLVLQLLGAHWEELPMEDSSWQQREKQADTRIQASTSGEEKPNEAVEGPGGRREIL